MKLSIIKVENGYLLTHPSPSYISKIDGKNIIEPIYAGDFSCTEVFETKDQELEPLVGLLYSILDNLNGCGSKHDEKRIFIEIRRGDGSPLGAED